MLPFLENTIVKEYKRDNKNIKLHVYEIVMKLLSEGYITIIDLMASKTGRVLLQHFEEEEDKDLLSSLVNIFSVALLNMEISPLTEKIEDLFDRV